MIVVEGPDGAGKTTLIRSLMGELPKLQLMPRAVASDMSLMRDLNEWTEETLRRGFGPFLYDRINLVSEPIYGALCRGKLRPGFTGDWYDRAWTRFTNLNPIVIACLPPWPVVEANLQRTDQPIDAVKPARAIYDLYCVWAYQHNWLRWDYTTDGPAGSLSRLCNFIRARVNGVSDH